MVDVVQELPSTACTGANACEYGYGYGDGSITEGYFSSDSVSFPASVGTVPNISFGCGVANEGNFGAADGLVGLGQGPVSLVSQLRNANIEPIFSYCLVGIYSTSTSPLLLGNASTVGIAFTPLVANPINPTFYYAGLTGIAVNGAQIDYPANSFAVNATDGTGGLIVDSGTTLTYLVQEVYTPILEVNLMYAEWLCRTIYPDSLGLFPLGCSDDHSYTHSVLRSQQPNGKPLT